MLEQGSGLVAGDGFHLVFSPERVLTGRVFADLRKYPKLVGGFSRGCEERGIAFYESVLDFDERTDLPRANGVWPMGSAEAAEMAKLAETTYRDVNIGLANQFAKFADKNGIDVYAVIEACNSQPYSHIHQPGIAVGGHCIPVYPRLYLHNDPDATIVAAAREANAEHAGVRGSAACRGVRGPDGREGRCARAPRTEVGSRRRPSLESSRSWPLCERPGRTSWSTTRCSPTTSLPRSAGSPTDLGEPGRCRRHSGRPRSIPRTRPRRPTRA